MHPYFLNKILEFDFARMMELASSLIPLLSILIFLFLFLKSSSTISKSPYSHIPGPKKLPLLGNLHLMLGASAPHRMLRDLAAKYGDLMHLQFGQIHYLVISSRDLAKEVMKTHDLNFANRPPGLTPEIIGYNYTSIGFAPYGAYWRHVRKICTLELLSTKRVHSFRHIREEENSNLAKWIASCKGCPIDVSERVYMSSFDVITRASIGAKTRDRKEFVSMIQETTKLAVGFNVADLYPSVKWLPLISGIRFKIQKMRGKVDGLMGRIIEQHRGKDGAHIFEDLVDVLLKFQQDGSDHPLTDDNIKAVLLNMFLAGSETSATVVEWAMSEMMRDRMVLEKAQNEVRQVFDEKGYVEEEKFDKLEYLKLVIKETLRLHPPAPLLMPRLNTQRCMIGGYEIPASSRVMINVWALGRDPKYWGNEAGKFMPERFIEKGMDYKGNNYEYMPFGSGRRTCPGMSFGTVNVEFTLATLLYHFDWEMIPHQDLDMTEAFGNAVGRKHHLHLIPTVARPLCLP